MELIKLIGNVDENFYQLGVKDRLPGKLVHNDVKRMLKTPWKPVNQVIEEVAKAVLRNTILKSDSFNHLKSYAEGMNQTIEETLYVMLIPELISSMSKWAPGFLKGQFGCSSFLTKNSDGEVIHGRILDFPLQGSYDQFERGVLYQFKNQPKIFGFGTSGIPYPSITLMTDQGITLALHQKFTNSFNPNGTPIFELIFKMVSECHDKNSIIQFLKNHSSITTWALYMTFKNGDTLAVDLYGKESVFSEIKLPENGIKYFCNTLLSDDLNQEDYLPLGFSHYNKMREDIASKKIDHLMLKENGFSDLDLLKTMATPIKQNSQIKHFNHYKLDTITASSLSVMVMNPTNFSSHYIGGSAPKVYNEEIINIKNIFSNPKIEKVKIPKKDVVNKNYQIGLKKLMEAQIGFDNHDPIVVYHNLQLAKEYLSGYPEAHIAQFYFLVAQYINEVHPKVLEVVYKDFTTLDRYLPSYLQDQCLLFLMRLERILDLPAKVEEDRISNKKLRAISDFEQKIPKAIFHISTKKMIVARIDILDIIYLYTF